MVNPEEELRSNDLETILRKFGQDLAGAGTTKLTIKNYLSDLRHFLGWVEDKAN